MIFRQVVRKKRAACFLFRAEPGIGDEMAKKNSLVRIDQGV